jgi:hypothetical protein
MQKRFTYWTADGKRRWSPIIGESLSLTESAVLLRAEKRYPLRNRNLLCKKNRKGAVPHREPELAQRRRGYRMMAFAKTEQEWADRAARHLKAELKRADVTYEELAKRLKEHGFTETKASIANKLTRATVSAHLFLASLRAIGVAQVRLEEMES